MTTTAIAAIQPRRPNTVRGEIVSVASFQRPWVRTDATIRDGTGELVLRFNGRASVPGFVTGLRVVARGTPGLVDGCIVMLNPLYSFAAED